MKYFLIAGEASGDLHASNLMKGLKKHDPHAEFRFMGGDLMYSISDGLVVHYRETSYMMLDVLFHLGKIFKTMRRVKAEIQHWKPDVVIPVDYPGFNLRMARFASFLGIKVFYFITPKVWAWKRNRIKQLKKYTNALFVIFPFEVDFFQQFNMEVEFFGNPLVDEVSQFKSEFEGAEAWRHKHGLDDKPIVALLAGSRRKEIESLLPQMVSVASEYPDYRFVVAGAPSIDPALYNRYLQGTGVEIVYQETYPLLESSIAGLITSGTATLETALFEVPQVVLYKTGSLAYGIAKRLIKINFISLVNLIHGKLLVVELIQRNLIKRSRSELDKILNDASYRRNMIEGYKAMNAELGNQGVSGRIGYRMVELLKLDLK